MKKNELTPYRRFYIGFMKLLMGLAAGITCIITAFIITYVLFKGLPHVTWNLISTKPSYLGGNIGILPDILNTLYIILATLLVVLPLGVGAAVYLNEYAANKKNCRSNRICRRNPFRHTFHNFRTGGNALLLSISRHEDLPCGGSHDTCNNESSHRYAYHPGKSENRP